MIPGLAPGGGDALIVSDYAAQSGTVHIVDPATGAELTDALKFIIEPDGTKGPHREWRFGKCRDCGMGEGKYNTAFQEWKEKQRGY